MTVFTRFDVEWSIGIRASVALVVIFLYLLGCGIYNLYFHPLSKYPGPLLWRTTRLRFIYSLVRGEIALDKQKIHEKYGEIVRIAPDELSFATPQAWTDIFLNRSGAPPFPKNMIYFKAPPGQVDSMLSTSDPVAHARMRKLLASAFTEQALIVQERTVQYYTDLLITKLKESTNTLDGKEGIADMRDWFNFYTFDITGDLGFGESFGCLEKGQYHPWIAMIFGFFRGVAILAAIRFYPWIEYAVIKFTPKSLVKMQQDHFQVAVEKVHRRLNLETSRDDFMTPVVNNNTDFKSMSLPEIHSTFGIIMIAGSETTATALSCTVNYLVQNPVELGKLVAEIRHSFQKASQINFAAVKGLPFLNAVINEGLRMSDPGGVGTNRVVPKGGGTVCGHFLPESTHVSIGTHFLYRSPKNFFRGESFLPARWLPPSSRPAEFEDDRRAGFQVFGLGPRGCIGKPLAWMQMRLALAKLAWHFDMDVVEEERLDWATLRWSVVVEKKPVKIKLKARAQPEAEM